MSDLNLRPATEADAPFLAKIICMAERSGAERSAYEVLFGLSEAELLSLLTELAMEDIVGCELGYPGFVIVEDEGLPVAACAGWIEGTGNQAASLLRAQMLAYGLGAARWKNAQVQMKTLALVEIPREPGCLQLESFGVLPTHRGRGVVQLLIDWQLSRYKDILKSESGDHRAQIQLLNTNRAAQRAYNKAGFELVRERWTDNPAIRKLLPGSGKVLLERVM